jgi:hypothetical protein
VLELQFIVLELQFILLKLQLVVQQQFQQFVLQ